MHIFRQFNVADFKSKAVKIIDDILKRGKLPIIVGGTGLYVWSVVDNLDIPKIAPSSKLRKELEKKSLAEMIALPTATAVRARVTALARTTSVAGAAATSAAAWLARDGAPSPDEARSLLQATVAGNGSNPSFGTIAGTVRVDSIEDAVEIDGGEMAAPVNCSGHGAPTIS